MTYVTATSTSSHLTDADIGDLRDEIVRAARQLVKKKWWQSKASLRARIEIAASQLNDFYESHD